MMRRVRASRVTDRLDLNKLGLHTLPAFALDLGYVSDLNIDYNSVASLPESLCWSLPCLTRLSARGNQLASPLPLRLGMLTQLTSIDVAQVLSSFPIPPLHICPWRWRPPLPTEPPLHLSFPRISRCARHDCCRARTDPCAPPAPYPRTAWCLSRSASPSLPGSEPSQLRRTPSPSHPLPSSPKVPAHAPHGQNVSHDVFDAKIRCIVFSLL